MPCALSWRFGTEICVSQARAQGICARPGGEKGSAAPHTRLARRAKLLCVKSCRRGRQKVPWSQGNSGRPPPGIPGKGELAGLPLPEPSPRSAEGVREQSAQVSLGPWSPRGCQRVGGAEGEAQAASLVRRFHPCHLSLRHLGKSTPWRGSLSRVRSECKRKEPNSGQVERTRCSPVSSLMRLFALFPLVKPFFALPFESC